MSTVALLDAVKVRHGLGSDYAAASLLGLTRSQVSRYRSGKDYFGDEVALRVAALLGEDAAAVLADVHAERAKDEGTRAVWRGLAARLRGGAVAAGVGLVVGFSGGPDALAAAPSPEGGAVGSLYIMSTRLRRLLQRLAHLVKPPIWAGPELASA